MLSLGIDFGTSGARAIAVSLSGDLIEEVSVRFNGAQTIQNQVDGSLLQTSDEGAPVKSWPVTSWSATSWAETLWTLLGALRPETRGAIERIAINGTSATMLLCDGHGQPLTEVLRYNTAIARPALSAVKNLAPPGCAAVLSATSTLVKAVWLNQQQRPEVKTARGVNIVHQADFLAHLLHRQPPVTDYHNALKLGYDVRQRAYPDWLLRSTVAQWLPEVVEPGTAIAPIAPHLADQFSFPATCQICAGTTDSIAAFLASGAQQPGEAVTSLGSTLVLKLLSPTPVDDPAFGIYSHRLGNLWLVGGASNTGGAVLKQFFSPAQLTALSAQINLSKPTPYDYYPLNKPGERFPINDPDYPPRLTPRPESAVEFLHGLLDAIARIEAQGYQQLIRLGAPELRQVYTAGGGAKNLTWQALRQRRLVVPVTAAPETEAAYGTAQLAMWGLKAFR
ncbi:MAG: FGGY-family carbohydrate kinase [Cyanobacteria bacterium J06634_5]